MRVSVCTKRQCVTRWDICTEVFVGFIHYAGVLPIYNVSQKKPRQKLSISITIQYRIIIVSLLGRALSPARFDFLMALVHKKALHRNCSNAPTPTPLQQHLLFSKCLLLHYSLVNWYGWITLWNHGYEKHCVLVLILNKSWYCLSPWWSDHSIPNNNTYYSLLMLIVW